MLFIGILFAAFLGACSSVSPNPTSAPTTVSASASPYDGAWQGTGTAQDGRPITVKFTVTDGAISSFIYSYPKADNSLTCTGLDHAAIPAGSQPRITNNSFSQTFGPDLTADGTFTISGFSLRPHLHHLAGTLYQRLFCNPAGGMDRCQTAGRANNRSRARIGGLVRKERRLRRPASSSC